VTAELVEQAQRGDREAFERLVRPAYHRLYAVAFRIVRDADQAEDAIQDGIVRCWRDLRGLRDPERFDAWLYRLVVNACRDQVRRARRRPVEVRVLPMDRESDAEEFARLDDRDELERAFARLSIEHRSALVLTHYLGMSVAEAAAVLRVPPGTVYSRVHYAIQATRGLIAADRLDGGRATDATAEHVR
jgi:RNA polymerase sigma-70 factor (ECF subfamily)